MCSKHLNPAALLLATLLAAGGCGHGAKEIPPASATSRYRLGPASQPFVELDEPRNMTVVQRDVVLFATLPRRTNMNDALVATVIMKNIGRQATPLGYVVPVEDSFRIDVQNSDGVSIPKITTPQPETQPVPNIIVLPSLLPGEAVTARYELQKIFHIEAPGQYYFLAASNMAGQVPDDMPVIVRVPFTVVRP